MQKRAPAFTSTATKLSALALCVLLVSQISPSYARAAGVVGAAGALTTFSGHISRGMHPGFFTTQGGGEYCRYVPEKQIPFDQCDQVAPVMDLLFQIQAPDIYKEVDAVDLHSKGFELGIPPDSDLFEDNEIERVTLGNDPRKYTNYQAALKYLEKEVLQNDRFLEKTPKQLIQTIHKTHKLMQKNLPVQEVGHGGHYRDQFLHVSADHVDKTPEGMIAELRRVGGTRRDEENLLSSIKKVRDAGDSERGYSLWTEEEKSAWKKIGHLAPDPEEIPSEMETFATQILEKLRFMVDEEGDPIETAAWAHQEIGRIHPYADANGRLARAFMNTVLQMGGIEAIVFPDDNTYTEAIVADQRGSSGSFTNFLEETVAWNRAQGFGLAN